jgi:hypothetical protein
MWGWLTDIRTLRCAWRRVASNRGARTPGVDGMTVKRIRAKLGEQCFVEGIQAELRSGAYRPSPSRRILIPKAGKPGKFRPLGIPRLRTASFRARSKSYWSLSLKRSFGMFPMGFGPDETAMALWSTSAEPPRRRNATRTIDGAGCRSGLKKDAISNLTWAAESLAVREAIVTSEATDGLAFRKNMRPIVLFNITYWQEQLCR